MKTFGDFGFALQVLREGQRVARVGWNGKGMWLLLINGSGKEDSNTDIDYILRDDSDTDWLDGLMRFSWIGMKTANNEFVPWVASQTDILATDWRVID